MSLRARIDARLSRFPRLRGLVRAGLGAGLLAGLGVWAIAHYDEFARVQAVEVVGGHHATPAAVRHLADIRAGGPLLMVDLERVVAQVMEHPWVAEATVSVRFPGVVEIAVREHEDPLLLLHPTGLFRVNPEGEVFVRARSTGLDRPVLTGLDATLTDEHPAVGQRVVREALVWVDRVAASGFLDPEQLSEVHFDRALGYTLRLRNGSNLHMGFRDPAAQLERLRAMVEAGLDLRVPHRIDLDMDGLAVATPLAS